MKNLFTKNHLATLALLFIFNFSSRLQAQTLQEIPNPVNYSLSFFTGGENGNLFFEYNGGGYYGDLFHYDGMDLNFLDFGMEVNFPFYSNTYNGNHYIAAYDYNFNQLFFEFDGTTVQEIPLPAGFQFSNYIGEYDSKMYVSLFDLNFNTTMFEYDGTTLTPVTMPAGFTYGGFVSIFDDVMYLLFYDANFNSFLFGFDGTDFTNIPTPAGTQFSFVPGETDEKLYLVFYETGSYNNLLFTFDGTTLEEIPNPTGFQFGNVMYLGDDLSYFSYFDFGFNDIIFTYDGSVLTELTTPAGLQFPFYVNTFDGKDFFSFYDANFDQKLYNYDGSEFSEVTAGAGLTFSQYADTIAGKAYYIFWDINFNGKLIELEAGTNNATELASPAGFTYNNFATSLDEKLFIGYDNAFFNSTLFIYDGTEFIEVENPAGKVYSFFMTEDLGELYLRYNDVNSYNGTLYKLRPNSIPTSADNSVYTLINNPYFFSSNDFEFADTDGDDLETILITEIETIGNLLLDGAHVYAGDVIASDDLPKLVFFPNTDDEGLNYDLFKFKVGDGDDFSDFDYIMNINVVDELPVANNNISLNANILLYPVPVENFATLQLDSNQPIESIQLRIFSMNGKIVFENNYKNIGNDFQTTIDIAQLPAGQYYIHGKTPNGIFTKPFVK